jgi:hypothetical protein
MKKAKVGKQVKFEAAAWSALSAPLIPRSAQRVLQATRGLGVVTKIGFCRLAVSALLI